MNFYAEKVFKLYFRIHWFLIVKEEWNRNFSNWRKSDFLIESNFISFSFVSQNWRRKELNHKCIVPLVVHWRPHSDWRHRHEWNKSGELALENLNHSTRPGAVQRYDSLQFGSFWRLPGRSDMESARSGWTESRNKWFAIYGDWGWKQFFGRTATTHLSRSCHS